MVLAAVGVGRCWPPWAVLVAVAAVGGADRCGRRAVLVAVGMVLVAVGVALVAVGVGVAAVSVGVVLAVGAVGAGPK